MVSSYYVMCVVVGIFTLAITLFFGPRLGLAAAILNSTLGLWGCLTVPAQVVLP